MSGHSHWAGIKHKKGVADQKRGRLFSKLLAAISAAAKTEPNPDFNPRLRTAIEKAKEHKVPLGNIERAVARARDSGETLEEVVFEAYGPGGAAMLIEAVTDNRNRAIAEVKTVLNESGGKWAEAGSVRWAFDQAAFARGEGWRAKFPQALQEADRKRLIELVAALEECADVQKVHTNAE